MKFLVTGATSFIGIECIKHLLFEGNDVVAVYRPNSLKEDSIPQSAFLCPIRLEESKGIDAKISNADVFIHLAWAGTGHDGRNDYSLQDANVKYSLDAIRAAHRMGCKLFVFAGSQAEYGCLNEKLTEDLTCYPNSEYGKAKLAFGKQASLLCQELGMKFIHLRICSLFGERDHSWTLVMSTIRKMLNNEDVQLSSCEQLWNFLDAEDAAKQIYLLCQYALHKENFKSEVFLICSHDTRKLRSFVEEMKILTNSNSRLLYGEYDSTHIVSLNPSTTKTATATGGFIASKTFSQVVTKIIGNFKNNIYD